MNSIMFRGTKTFLKALMDQVRHALKTRQGSHGSYHVKLKSDGALSENMAALGFRGQASCRARDGPT